MKISLVLLLTMSEARKPRIPHHPAPGRHIEPPSNYPEEADRVTGKIRKSSRYSEIDFSVFSGFM